MRRAKFWEYSSKPSTIATILAYMSLNLARMSSDYRGYYQIKHIENESDINNIYK